MQTFDRLKIVAAIDAIDVVDESVFAKTLVNGNVVSMKYYREMPTKLMIKVDYASGEVVVEFTGKILGHNYPHLISMANIEECFINIESLGFCRFDMDLLMRSEVVSCDVTKDVQCSDVRKVQSYIRSHISNYNKYMCRALKNGNVVLEKNVTTRKNKKRMTIYDKEQEMKKSDNTRFMQRNGLTDEFVGKCRFEINLNSKEQIRNALHIEDTNLLTVLNSETNPILEFMDEAKDAEAFSEAMCQHALFLATAFTEKVPMVIVDDKDFGEALGSRLRNSLHKEGLVLENSPILLSARAQDFVFYAATLMTKQYLDLIQDSSAQKESEEVFDLRRGAFISQWVDRFLGKR